MKWRMAIVIVLLLVAHSAYGNNILQNPGFENGLTSWTTTVGAAIYTADSSVVHTGRFSVRGVESQQGSLGRLFQDVTGRLIVGEQYTISGWIKTQDVVGAVGAIIILDYVDQVGAVPTDGNIVPIGFVTGTQDWTFFMSAPFTLPPKPPDASSLHFALDFAAASGTAWFDDLTLSGPVASSAFAWHGPITTITTGVTGNPSFVQAIPGTYGTKGNYELVVPLQSGGLAHFYRDNDDPALPWYGPFVFATDQGIVDAVSLIQSNFSSAGNSPGSDSWAKRLEFFEKNGITGPWKQLWPPCD